MLCPNQRIYHLHLGPCPLYCVSNQRDFNGWIGNQRITLHDSTWFWPWPPVKMVPERLARERFFFHWWGQAPPLPFIISRPSFSLSLPFPLLAISSPFPLKVGPWNPARWSGVRCKLHMQRVCGGCEGNGFPLHTYFTPRPHPLCAFVDIHSFIYLIQATWPIEHTHVDKQTRN